MAGFLYRNKSKMVERGGFKNILIFAWNLPKQRQYYFEIKNEKLYSYSKKEADICKDEININEILSIDSDPE